MRRVVLDTNVVISGLLWKGAPAQVIDVAIDEQLVLVSSESLLAELKNVLSRSKFDRYFAALDKSVEEFIDDYRALVTLVEPLAIEPVIIADPTDDAVLACAVSGKADVILSGDKHLLMLGSYADIAIRDVNQFLEEFLN